MADYKILQNIDLAQNEIKEVSKIANDREDGEDKGLLIQTGNNTSLAFNRKIDTSNTINSIKGTVKDGTGEDKKESALNLEPSKVIISNTKGTETSTNSTITIGLTTPDSEGKEHIEAVSPSIDIKTGKTEVTDYAHPYISLKKDGSTLGLQSKTVEIRSEGDTKSSLTMNGGITGVSNNIFLGDSDTEEKKVSLTLNSDGTNGTISETASKSITETVYTRSVSLINDGINDGIEIKDSTTSGTPSIIKINNDGIKASKGLDSSYVDIQSEIIKEQSNEVTIQTPNVILNLNESSKSASLTSTEGTITLTSQGDAETKYDNNIITTKADTITIKAKGYTETEATKYYPHIELKSTKDTNSVLLEGKTIGISSKKDGSNIEDTITLSGSKLNVKSTTTEITSNTINVGEDGGILSIDTTTSETTPSITIPLGTKTDIKSTVIRLGESDSNSTTTISGSEFNVNTDNTSITSDTTISGTTTIKSSASSPANTILVNGTSTSITGSQADINPANVNIGTVDNSTVIIGKDNAKNTTTLNSKITSITSPTLNVVSPKVDFNGKNQKVIFEGTSEGTDNSSVTSKVPTYIKDTTFSVDKTTDSSIVFKVDTSNKSTTINGKTATINPTNVNIGTETTNAITIGRNATGTPTPTTTLQSSTTEITSPTINIGTDTSSSSVFIGKTSSDVTLTGRSNFSVTATNTNSKVQANDLKFNTSLSSNDIKIYWDSTLNSLVFAKA